LTERALSAALSMGGTVIAVSVAGDDAERDKVRRAWDQWGPGVTLEILLDPHRSLIRSVLSYIRSIEGEAASITVLIPEVVPHKRRHELLHNQRGRLLADALRAKTDVAVTTLPFRLRD
jgi:hypothetical protein